VLKKHVESSKEINTKVYRSLNEMKQKYGEIFLISELKIHIKDNHKGKRIT